MHCEIICIKEIQRNYPEITDFGDITLYVTCEPCIMCAYAINLMSKILGTYIRPYPNLI